MANSSSTGGHHPLPLSLPQLPDFAHGHWEGQGTGSTRGATGRRLKSLRQLLAEVQVRSQGASRRGQTQE